MAWQQCAVVCHQARTARHVESVERVCSDRQDSPSQQLLASSTQPRFCRGTLWTWRRSTGLAHTEVGLHPISSVRTANPRVIGARRRSKLSTSRRSILPSSATPLFPGKFPYSSIGLSACWQRKSEVRRLSCSNAAQFRRMHVNSATTAGHVCDTGAFAAS